MNDEESAERRVAKRLRAARDALGLTQEEVAEEMRRLGHSWRQTTVTKTEAADRPLRVNELVHLAAVVGVDVGALLSSAEFHERIAAAQQLRQAEASLAVAEAELREHRAAIGPLEAEVAQLQATAAEARRRIAAAEAEVGGDA